ncbi:MAG: hypothetical protein H7X77_03570, partial [Anaerolineae bacterium]|nr:hypothetical protein [Anaerolineae bacterium]
SFGSGLALQGNKALIGMPATKNMSAVYVFIFNGNSWVQGQKLVADNPSLSYGFGASIAISDNLALVGVPGGDVGEVYSFSFNGSTWGNRKKFSAHDSRHNFGRFVILRGNAAVVVATTDYHFQISGDTFGSAAYFFTLEGSQWIERQAIASTDWRGISVALSANRLLLGAPTDPTHDDGVGYIYEFPF